MPTIRPFFSNFTRGELSPYVYARSDLGAYYNGLEIAENVIVLPEGGARRRSGTRVVTEIKDTNHSTILIPYIRAQDLSYVVEAGAGYMRFFKDGQPVYDAQGPELITNGGFDAGLTGWTQTGFVLWLPSEGYALLIILNGAYAEIKQTINATLGVGLTLMFDVRANSGPADLYIENSDKAYWQRLWPGHNLVNFMPTSTTPTLIFRKHPDPQYSDNAGIDNVSVRHHATPVEVATSYVDSELGMIQWVQSIDVLFLQHQNHGTAKLSSVSDQQWSWAPMVFNPPPSVETGPTGAELAGGTLHLSDTIGTVTMHTDNPVFLAADSGRTISAFGGLYQGLISTVNGPQDITVIISSGRWPATGVIGEANWQLNGSPLTSLDSDKKAPIGATANLNSGEAFRATDVGKFLRLLGGTILITAVTDANNVVGQIMSELSDSTKDDPDAVPSGAWTLEEAAWSVKHGYPATIEFHQGRLIEAATPTQPTTVWGSATDNFENFALGTLAADSYAFTVRSGKANPLTWLTSVNELLWGESDYAAPIQPLKIDTSIRYAQGPGNNEPIGGASIPYVGSSKGTIYFVHSTRTEIRALAYDIQQDGLTSKNLTILGRHLFDPKEGGSPIKQAAIAYAEKRDSVIYLLREDGQLVAFTIYEQEQVTAFTRLITDGAFESVAVIPKGSYNQVWVIVRRVVNGVTKRFVEYFEDSHELLTGRKYSELITDCASVANVTAPTSVFPGFNHLIGKTVDVIWHSTATAALKSGNFIGTFVVDGSGQVTLPYTVSDGVIEIGLRFTPRMKLVRPASPQQNMEGIPRKWNSIWARIKDTNSLTCNGENFQFVEPGDPLDEGPQPKSMDVRVIGQGWSTDNELIFSQSFPGPMTILGAFGSLQLGAD